MDKHEKVEDEFKGVKIWWVSESVLSGLVKGVFPQHYTSNSAEPEKKYYKATFHKKHRDLVTEEYFKHVVYQGKEISVKNRQRKLYTNVGRYVNYFTSLYINSCFNYRFMFSGEITLKNVKLSVNCTLAKRYKVNLLQLKDKGLICRSCWGQYPVASSTCES